MSKARRKRKSRRYRLTVAIAATISLLVIAAGAWLAVGIGGGAKPSPRPPAASRTGLLQPAFTPDRSELKGLALPTAAPLLNLSSCQHNLGTADGVWLPDWANDPSRPVLRPQDARAFNLVDLWWLYRGNSPTSITTAPGALSLSAALGETAIANRCAWRFVTVSDLGETPAAQAMQNAMTARILLDARVRREHVQALARTMAGHVLAQGLDLDYEYSLPTTVADLQQAAQAAGLTTRDPAVILDRMTRGYDQLVWDLTQAMHQSKRWLRVTVMVRTDNDTGAAIRAGYVKPYLLDYRAIAAISDRMDVMAYDVHWAEDAHPGPIAPMAEPGGVDDIIRFVRAQTAALAKVGFGAPNYAYDWTVGSDGLKLASSPAARDYTATELAAASTHWRHIVTVDGWVYNYTDAAGHRHVVYDASSGLQAHVAALHRACHCAVTIWKVANTDPAGTALAAQALGH